MLAIRFSADEEEVAILRSHRGTCAKVPDDFPPTAVFRDEINQMAIGIIRPNGRRDVDWGNVSVTGKVLADAATVYSQQHPTTINKRVNHAVNLSLTDRGPDLS